MWIIKVTVIVCVIVARGYCELMDDLKGLNIVERTINECIKANESYSCMPEKVARVLERSMEWDVPLMDGMTLARNNEKINHRQARLLGILFYENLDLRKGFDRLNQAIQNFFQTHVISLELGGARKLGKKGGGMGGFGGGGINKKALRREGKYMQYAFMVLLGIFGLTGPLVMKVLAMMAAKALLAAKAALIIVGSVALKKLFEKDHHHEPSIKVHTISHDDDEHDRLSKYGSTGYGYETNSNSNFGQYYNNPYSSYYDDYYTHSAAKNNKIRK